MKEQLYLITGISRGLGEGFARSLLRDGHTVFGIARSDNASLRAFAQKSPGTLIYRRFDVTDIEQIPNVIKEAFELTKQKHVDRIVLVNNAGIVMPLGPVETHPPAETERNIRINLAAPMIFTSNFLSNVRSFSAESVVIAVSSGAAENFYFGRSAYCAAKAGLEHFIKVAAKEITEKGEHTKIFAVRPGVIDTDMQSICRAAPKEQIMDTDQFIQLKKDGKLLQPEATAGLVLRTIEDSRVHHGEVVDIRNLYPEET